MEAHGSGWHSCSGAQGMEAQRFGGGSCSTAPIDRGLMAVASQSGAELERRPRGAEVEVDHSEE
jgi:hypothetical protein